MSKKEIGLVNAPVSIDEIRNNRDQPDRVARKLASSIYPTSLKPFAQGFHNSNNVFEERFSRLILEEKPLQFVSFWGVGGKQAPDQEDVKLLDELSSIDSAIWSKYPKGAEVALIVADSHGQFNGYEGFEEYLSGVWHMAEERGIHPIALSHLYQQSGLTLPNPQDDISSSLESYQQIWSVSRYSRQIEQLIESAGKHSRAGVKPEVAAFHYVQMRHQEKKMLSQFFPDAAILVNGSKSLGKLTLPLDMPHMYLKVPPAWFHQGEPLESY